MKIGLKVFTLLMFPVTVFAQTRNDAGLKGNAGAVSGFFETANPVNYPAGAEGWWHLLDVRHSDLNNNFAMQFSGSFFSQDLYFRKTADVANRPWSRVLLESEGKVGIGTTNPQNRLQISGGHGDTNMNLHYGHPDPNLHADLTLWASEPGWTYTGTGIGNNVYNSSSGPGIIRMNTLKGGSYLRLLDQELRLNVVKKDGTDVSALAVDPSGNVGVGTTTPKEKLSVNGNIRAKEIKVETASWPDYVFAKDYALPSLKETEQHMQEKGHLPGIPSAQEVKSNGVDLGEMNAKLLKKIEELTLHLIEKDKQLNSLLDINKVREQNDLKRDKVVLELMERLKLIEAKNEK